MSETARALDATQQQEVRCPYQRPFAADFDACPGFLPRLELPVDSVGSPMRPIWTCAHLASEAGEDGGFFALCLLGTAQDRTRWAQAMGSETVTAIRRARIESSEHFRPQLERLRAAVLGLGSRPAMLSSADEQVADAARDLIESFNAFVDEHPDLFRRAKLETDALKACFSEAMTEFLHRAPSGSWRMADHIVRKYPWPIVAFFRPDLVTTPPTSPD